MSVPMNIGSYPDVLDIRFHEIASGEYEAERDMIGDFYGTRTPTQYTEKVSAMTPMGLYSEFGGSLTYDSPDQGYDAYAEPKEYALAMQIERLLLEYERFDIIDTRSKLLGRSARQTRQVHAARLFNNIFTLDTAHFTRTNSLPICSTAQTTTRAGVSTSTGFNNVTVAALSPTGLKAAYITGRKFKDDAGQPLDNHELDLLLVPPDLKDRAHEIVKTVKGIDSSDHTINVLEDRYNVKDWIRLTDVNNYFLINSKMMKEALTWLDKVPVEFAKEEAFDNIVAKYRGYMVYHILASAEWRWVLGANVT